MIINHLIANLVIQSQLMHIIRDLLIQQNVNGNVIHDTIKWVIAVEKRYGQKEIEMFVGILEIEEIVINLYSEYVVMDTLIMFLLRFVIIGEVSRMILL